jgi:hypothetical protein
VLQRLPDKPPLSVGGRIESLDGLRSEMGQFGSRHARLPPASSAAVAQGLALRRRLVEL